MGMTPIAVLEKKSEQSFVARVVGRRGTLRIVIDIDLRFCGAPQVPFVTYSYPYMSGICVSPTLAFLGMGLVISTKEEKGIVPKNNAHYVGNIGKGPVEFLEMFRVDRFQDFSTEQWLEQTPGQMMAEHSNLEGARRKKFLEGLRREKVCEVCEEDEVGE